MGRITREMADKAAEQLAAVAFDKKIEKAKKEFSELVKQLIETYVPAPIIAVAKEYCEFLSKAQRIYIGNENGDCIWCYDPPANLPVLNLIKVSKSDYHKLKMAENKLKSYNTEKSKYENEVSDALCLSLRTGKRVAESFPEALPYLNISGTTTLAPDFSNLRNMLINKEV